MLKLFKKKKEETKSISIEDKIQYCIDHSNTTGFSDILEQMRDGKINIDIEKYKNNPKFKDLFYESAFRFIYSFDYFKYDILSDKQIIEIVSHNITSNGLFRTPILPNVVLKDKNLWIDIFKETFYKSDLFINLPYNEYNDNVLNYILNNIDNNICNIDEPNMIGKFFNNVEKYIEENKDFEKNIYNTCLNNGYTFKYAYKYLDCIKSRILSILSINGEYIKFIQNDQITEEMRIVSIKNNPSNIQYIDNNDINIELFKLSIDIDPHCIKYIKEPTESMIMYTFKKDCSIIDEFESIDNDMMLDSNIEMIVQTKPDSILKMKNANQHIWMIALKKNGMLLKYLKDQTQELSKIAIDQNKDAKKYSLFTV